MIELKSNRLLVEIPYPGEGINRTTRFSRAAFIQQVTLDGRHRFCNLEPVRAYLPRSGGAGLCSEIKANSLIEEAKVGGYFPKFGVGLLKKPDEEPYSFRRNYECRPFRVDVEADGATAVFETEAYPCLGYALRDRRTVTAEDNTLTVRYEFENCGEKALELGEYCHNFVTIDELPLGEDYRLEMAVMPQDGRTAQQPEGVIIGRGCGFTFKGYDEHPCTLLVEPESIRRGGFFWRLSNRNSPCVVMEETGFRPARILIWSVDFNISPECYHQFALAPGERAVYWRRWTFTDETTR